MAHRKSSRTSGAVSPTGDRDRSPSPAHSNSSIENSKIRSAIGMKFSGSSLLRKLNRRSNSNSNSTTDDTSIHSVSSNGNGNNNNSSSFISGSTIGKLLRGRSLSNPNSLESGHTSDGSVIITAASPQKSIDGQLANNGRFKLSQSPGTNNLSQMTNNENAITDDDDSNDNKYHADDDIDYDSDNVLDLGNEDDIDDEYDDEYDYGEAQLNHHYHDEEANKIPHKPKTKIEKDIEEASSVIGGSSLVQSEKVHYQKGHGEDGEYEDEKDIPKSSQKVFSFSLPMGSTNFNITKFHLPKIITSSTNLANFALNSESLEERQKRSEIKMKIERGNSISTLEEELMFKNVTSLRNERVQALKKAFTPNFLSPNYGSVKPDYVTIFDELEGDVLLLGGYRGSILRDSKTHRRAWIPVFKAGLNLRKIDLFIGPSDEDEKNVKKTLYPDGILDTIGPVDICHKLIKRFQSNPKINFHNFGYDWRISLDITSHQLEEKLKEINIKNGGKGCIVISHSMGGLVVHGALQRNPSLFSGVVYVGTPYPSPNVLGPTRFGDKVLFDTKMLSPENNFMMRSSFIFLPTNGEIFKDKITNEKYNLDFFNPDIWVEYNLSPLVCKERKLLSERNRPLSPIKNSSTEINNNNQDSSKANQPITTDVEPQNNPTSMVYGSSALSPVTIGKGASNYSEFQVSFDDAYDYLSRTLKRTREYLDKLPYDETKKDQYPPLTVVYGNRVPSVRFSMVDGINGIKDGDWYDFSYGPGDGVVHQRWLMPESAGFPIVGKFVSVNAHMDLLNDLDNIGKALVAIKANPRVNK